MTGDTNRLSDEDKELCRQDRIIYGQYFVMHNADGTVKRIPPREVYKDHQNKESDNG